MKKFSTEKFGLAVNVFSWVALMLLLLGAYIFRPDQHGDDKERIEEKLETIEKKPVEVFHSSIQIKSKKMAIWDDPSGILLDQFDKY